MHPTILRPRRYRALTLIAAIASASAIALCGTAQASSAQTTGQSAAGTVAVPADQSACPSYSLCLWQNASFNESTPGNFWYYDYFTNPDDQWIAVGPKANNSASSLWNNRAWPTLAAQFAGGTGLTACLGAGVSYGDLTQWNWYGSTTTMNDSITSIYLASTNVC